MDTGIASNRFVLATLLLVAVALTGAPGATYAAPGQIADSPLFLTSSAKPNIIFTLDNSGSMGWTEMPDEVWYGGYNAATGTNIGSNGGQYHCYENSDYNKVYYNPNTTYPPGVDSTGASLGNASFTAAQDDGYYTYDSVTGTTNLSTSFRAYDYGSGARDTQQAAYYYKYTGTSPATPDPTTCYPDSSYTRVDIGAAEQQNFANWYSYYRTRILMMKTSLGRAFSGVSDQYRVGFSTINSNSSNFIPIDDFNATQKTDWFNQLYGIDPSGSTPLRKALQNDGEYFAGNNNSYPDPVQASCQQNFAILSTDGYWNGADPSIGDWDNTVRALPEPVTGLTHNGQWPRPYYEGPTATSDTLADMAMKYWDTDLRTSAALGTNNVPTNAEDPASWQHMTTYTIGLGANGTLTYPTDLASIEAGTKDWPVPISGTPTTIDDLWHAAVNGHGKYLQATDPTGLASGLAGILSNIVDRTGSAAAVSFNSTSLQANTLVYQAKFDSSDWSGSLHALDIDPTTGAIGNEAWNAASLLDTRDLTTNPRQIVTYNGSTGILFKWPTAYTSPTTGELTSAQIDDLLADGPYPVGTTTATEVAANQAYGQKIMDFLHGSHADEGTGAGQFRDRHGHRLGDIVHSAPVYVGKPDTPYPDAIEGTGNLYSTFAAAQANRPGMVYVGANDGMLHVFDSSVDASGNPSANAGQEVFAYIPSMLFSAGSGSGLHRLAEQTYTHKYYVDLSATAADVFVGGAWKTMLVGGLRGGGKGVFALDITNPSAFSTNPTSVPKWEFTNDNLGYTFSDIRIARMNNGKWAAIFGNGYNSDPNGDGKAKLFILYLDGSNLSNPIILDTGAGSIANGSCSDPTSDCNGLSTPAIADLNGDGNIDRIYAGDLQGHMWVFNVQDPSSANWKSAYSTTVGTVTTPEPLFTACAATPCTAANRQPITSKPALARHPTQTASATAPNLMVFFGTGQYLAAGDGSTTGTQSFYGVWDSGTKELDRDNLVAQTITTATYTTANDVRLVTDNPVDYVGSPPTTPPKYGWLIDLPTSKERVVTDPVAVGDLVFFNTMIPSSDICSYGGTGWLMSVKQINGGEPAFPPVDLNNDGTFDASDQVSGHSVAGTQTGGIPTGSRFISSRRVTTDSTGAIGVQSVQTLPPQPSARMSWTDLER